MKNLKVLLPTILLALSASVNAVTLTFEDIPGGSTQNSLGFVQTYQGFIFSPTLHWIDVDSPSYNYGAHSGDFAIINNYDGAGSIREANDDDFTFDGLWAKRWGTAANSGGSDSLFGTLAGYNNSVLVWEVVTSLNGSYEYYGPQTGLIDQLVLHFGSNFLVDDIALNEVSAIPVPAAAWLFGSALLGFFGFSRRKANA